MYENIKQYAKNYTTKIFPLIKHMLNVCTYTFFVKRCINRLLKNSLLHLKKFVHLVLFLGLPDTT